MDTGELIPALDDLGGWPILESNPGGNWNIDHFDLAKMLTRLSGVSPLVGLFVDVDQKNSDSYSLYVSDRKS